MSRLKSFRSGIWTVFQPLSYFGMRLGTRATIVELPSGALAIISPVEFDETTKKEIDALGEAAYIIAPNLFHHLYFNTACALWPEAAHLVPPGLSKKVGLVESAVDLADEGALEDSLRWHRVQGLPLLTEHIFISESHDTLVITDLAFHFRDHDQLWLRLAMTLAGAYNRFGPSLLERLAIRDKQAFGESLETILSYQWDCIALPHGDLIDEGGKSLFEEAFSPFLESR